MARKYFGTDGIRGRVGQGPINPEFVLKLGWAAGRVLGNGAGSKVLIGKDTRISGYMFEAALEVPEAERQAFVEQIQTTEALAGMARFLGKTAD